MAHGVFETMDANPKCPHGCSTIERYFSKPPSFPQKAPGIDRSLQNLANDFGMTDISNRNGSVMESRSQSDYAPQWVSPSDAQKQVGGAGGVNAVHQVQNMLHKPETMIPQSIREASARELK